MRVSNVYVKVPLAQFGDKSLSPKFDYFSHAFVESVCDVMAEFLSDLMHDQLF